MRKIPFHLLYFYIPFTIVKKSQAKSMIMMRKVSHSFHSQLTTIINNTEAGSKIPTSKNISTIHAIFPGNPWFLQKWSSLSPPGRGPNPTRVQIEIGIDCLPSTKHQTQLYPSTKILVKPSVSEPIPPKEQVEESWFELTLTKRMRTWVHYLPPWCT